ncbi:hypothetical protein FQU75_08865 [Paenibacillus polymyxa]|nr:hypothetical protein FQU75_08865 [Paenibacillus polymyxa]
MDKTIKQFNENIERIRMLHSVYLSYRSQITPLVDISDMLRSELVLLVSAVDFYVHEIVRIGMLEVFCEIRPETSSFRNYSISLKAVREALLNPESFDWLEREVIEKHSWKSFQQAEKITEALRIITDADFWGRAALAMNSEPQLIKKKLNLIVDRRNKIAHEADMDPSYPGSRWPIDDTMVKESIDFVGSLIQNFHMNISTI